MDFLEFLYQYAVEHRIQTYLSNDRDYEEELHYKDLNLEWLRSHLDGEALARLDNYRGSADGQAGYEYRALFRAGLALGLELARL